MTVLSDKPRVLNIPAGYSFADSLARGLLERAAQDPLALGDYLLLLPSRRACRTLRDAFLRLSGGQAIVLPRLMPVGDVDAEEVSLLLSGLSAQDEQTISDMPDAVPKMERQILLARAILSAGKAQSFDQAVALAQELGSFLDEVQTENLSFDGLQKLVPALFAGHWQQTLEFLKILTEVWPNILASRGVMDNAARRNALLAAQEQLWRQFPPAHPVIAAGSTGTVPAARALLSLVARLPKGELVLPGLDTRMDEDSWAQIGEDHPQFNMKKLLSAAGAERAGVIEWPLQHRAFVNHGRVRLLSEAMRPADTTERWRQLTPHDIPATALDGLTRIDCDTPQEEADVIALILREALETPGKTAALITPDRRLARRVTLSMRRWGIDIDDSGGQPLTELPVGAWLMLCAEMAAQSLAPVTLLSLLKHPVMAASMPADDMRRMTYLLDQLALRGPRPSGGFSGLRQAIEAIHGEKQAEAKQNLLTWLGKIEAIAAPFAAMMTEGEKPFRDMLEAHVKMAEDLAATVETSGASRLWLGEAGEGASQLLGQLLGAAGIVPALSPPHYVPLLRMLMKSVTVRPRYGVHPRLSIMGQVEARLYCADLVILGGMNEGTWPALPAHDPWMSRPMRREFGLPSPEKALSLASHDFVQAASAPEVVLTRAQKVDGTPTVPARWLLRIDAVLEAVGMAMPMAAGQRYKQWRQDMDMPAEVKPAPRPSPAPPVYARPRQLSVTRIESWMRDPYQIYAQYVLNLRAFDPIDADPGGAERGTFIHAALEHFIKAYPDNLPVNAEQKLVEFGRAALIEQRVPQDVEAFWWPRFEKIAHQFVQQEADWRQGAKPYATEAKGQYVFATAGGEFTLSGTADRIDRLTDGSYAIIDYKSGGTPSKTDVRQGLSPQLPLEALMLRHGAFKDMPMGETSELVYWRVTGSGQKPVERITLSSRDISVADMTDAAQAGLLALVEKFDDPATPYLSQPRAEAKPKFSDYEHLARVREWSIGGDDAEDAA